MRGGKRRWRTRSEGRGGMREEGGERKEGYLKEGKEGSGRWERVSRGIEGGRG
jgi:hypothetical protein